MGLRKSGKQALIRITGPNGTYIDLSGVDMAGRGYSNSFAYELGANVQDAGGFNEDWIEAVPVGASFWKAAVSTFYSSNGAEAAAFLDAMHTAQHQNEARTPPGDYTLTIAAEGICAETTEWRGSHAVLLTRSIEIHPENLLVIQATFAGWTFGQAVYAALVATGAGLYYAEPFTFDATDPIWTPVGSALDILQLAWDREQPFALQVCRTESSVWLRQPHLTGDDWQEILTADQIQAALGNSNEGGITWVEYNTVLEHIYVLWNYDLTKGGLYLLKSADYGNHWSAVAIYDSSFNYEGGNITAGLQSGNLVYVTASTGMGSPGRVYRSTDGGDSFALAWTSSHWGGWTPLLFVDPQDESVAYLGDYVGMVGQFNLLRSQNQGASFEEVDGALDAGTLLSDYYAAAWINPYATRIVCTVRNTTLYYTADGWATGAERSLGSLRMWALNGADPARLVCGRYDAASVDDPHLVFSLHSAGSAVYDKGGANAGQADGGGDSIPYTAAHVARNGIILASV